MKLEKTHRGFYLRQFKDYYGEDCSIQESSLATRKCIWLGCDEANPRVLIPGEGWRKIVLPKDTLCNTRMHLTRKQVFKLLPILMKFIITGEI